MAIYPGLLWVGHRRYLAAGGAVLAGDAPGRGAARAEPRPMKAKHQRLTLALIALVALIGAGVLAAWAL
ncbi:MAG: hypothetical protein ACK442_11995, partial [Novosphingobium sp.]